LETTLKVLSVSWNANSDITKIKFTEEFLTVDWIVKADVLKDLAYIIENQYQSVLDNSEPVKWSNKKTEEILRSWKYE
jgi:hypothetical protein